MNRAENPRRRAWTRWGVPLAIAAVFAAPPILAWLVYQRTAWQPTESLAQGVLMHPAQPLKTPPLVDRAGHPLDGRAFRGHWTLMYLAETDCPAECVRLMDTLRRICRARTKPDARLQRVLVARALPEAQTNALARTDPALRLLLAAGDWPLAAGQVYLIDPLGNLVLRYPPGFAPEGLGDDLARLLRLSRIG